MFSLIRKKPPLPPGEILVARPASFTSARACYLQVLRGQAWLTLGCGGQDILLAPGEACALPPGALAVVSPLGPQPLVLRLVTEKPPGRIYPNTTRLSQPA